MWMTRTIPKLAVSLLGLFVLPLFVIRAQPYDQTRHDPALRAFLMPPEDCAAPCFLGIQPGITTLEQAATILEQHSEFGFEAGIAGPQPAGTPTEIRWSWNTSRRAINILVESPGGTISRIIIYGIPLRDIWLSIGQPTGTDYRGESVYSPHGRVMRMPESHIMFYADYRFRVTTDVNCLEFWQQHTIVEISPDSIPDNLNRYGNMTLAYQRHACNELRQYRYVYSSLGPFFGG
jgi:hypothetical protein